MLNLDSETALIRASIADTQRELSRIRSEMMELIVGTRHAIAQSRFLIAEADALMARPHCHFGAMPQSAKNLRVRR
jgi:hypothetical protein